MSAGPHSSYKFELITTVPASKQHRVGWGHELNLSLKMDRIGIGEELTPPVGGEQHLAEGQD